MAIHITGEMDVAHKRLRASFGMPGTGGREETIVDASRVLYRVVSSDPLTAQPWCKLSGTKTSPGPGVSPIETLTELATTERKIEKLGVETVRGVQTTHYRVSGAGAPTVEIWVDANDMLRRLAWTHVNGHQRDTTDLYDFNKSASIVVPQHAPPCPPPRGSGATLGNSNTQLPPP
jgi:hypothetical protein